MNSNFYISNSTIHGKGVFANKDFYPEEPIATALIFYTPTKYMITPNFGIFINHQSSPKDNSYLKRVDNTYVTTANKFIKKGDEIVSDYDLLPPFLMRSKPHYK